jgi:hypothetical protein
MDSADGLPTFGSRRTTGRDPVRKRAQGQIIMVMGPFFEEAVSL